MIVVDMASDIAKSTTITNGPEGEEPERPKERRIRLANNE
jgi:hypothetical protein